MKQMTVWNSTKQKTPIARNEQEFPTLMMVDNTTKHKQTDNKTNEIAKKKILFFFFIHHLTPTSKHAKNFRKNNTISQKMKNTAKPKQWTHITIEVQYETMLTFPKCEILQK